MKTGIELIAQERAEQIEKHGRSVKSDCRINSDYQLTDVARIILINTPDVQPPLSERSLMAAMPDNWGRNELESLLRKDYRKRLIIAGALIAAELDRLN